MNKKTRLIILLFCVVCFFVIAPILVAYSEGYRFDFETRKIVATGGIYVRTFPAADSITVDSNITERPGLFSNYIFVQSLLPKNHTVSIKKAGYINYFKTLQVQEKIATKLENVVLFKKTIALSVPASPSATIFENQDRFVIKNNSLYYSLVKANAGLTALQKATPIVKNVIAFIDSGNTVTWLGLDGFLYQADVSDVPVKSTKITLVAVKINKKDSYKIISNGQYTFLADNQNLLMLNSTAQDFESFYTPVSDAKISPDGKNLLLWTGDKISLYSFVDTDFSKAKQFGEIFSGNTISNCQWINNDYIAFVTGDKIIISEVDYRGNVNNISLAQTATLANGKPLSIVAPQISFNSDSGKMYVLTQKTILVSDKITP